MKKGKGMRYLAFDIECCDGVHICEFGYVITDTQFNILEKNVFIINPEKPFNLTGKQNEDGIKLFFPEETYYAGEKFPFYYEKIKDLLEEKDQIVIGHAVSNDAGFIRTACKHYNLSAINFSFFDSQRVYAEYNNETQSISLENARELFHLDKPAYLHKSDDDALLTLQMMQKMCENLSISLTELHQLCPMASGHSINFEIKYTGSSLPEMLDLLSKNVDSLSNNRKARCVYKFAEKVEPQGSVISSKLSGCKLCFSSAFETSHIKETLVLIQMMADCACIYSTKVSENDYYVATDDELSLTEIPEHTRYYSANNDTNKCKILTFNEFYEMLSVTPQEIEDAPWPIIGNQQIKQKKKAQAPSGNTIGDQLIAKGIDLSKLFK